MKKSWHLLGILACASTALFLEACTATQTPTTVPAVPSSQPAAAPGATSTAPTTAATAPSAGEAIAQARSELAAGHADRALQLVKRLSDPESAIIEVLAQAALAKQSNWPEELLSLANTRAAELAQQNPKSPRFALLQMYLANPALQADAVRALLLDPAKEIACAATMAGIHNRSRDWKKVIADWRMAEALDPTNEQAVQGVFAAALLAKDYALAEEYAGKIRTGNLDRAQGRLALGLLHHAQGKADEAIAELVQATQAFPTNFNIWYSLGALYMEHRDFAQAREAMEKAAALDPNSFPPLKALLLLDTQTTPPTDPQRARDHLALAQKLAPNDPDLAKLADRIETTQQAIARRQAVLAAHPEDKDNRFRLATALSISARPTQAAEVAKPLYEKDPDLLPVAKLYATILAQMGNGDESIALFDRFINGTDKQKRYDALIIAGGIYQRELHQPDRAAEYYRRALPLQPPGDTLAQRLLGDLQFDSGDFSAAIESYQALRKADPKDLVVTRRLAESYVHAEKLDDADILLKQLLARNPDDALSLILLASMRVMQDKPQEALAPLNRVLKSDPNNASALYYRALARFDAKTDLEPAIADLERIAATDDSASRRRLLARLYQETRQNDKADENFQQAMKMAPSGSPLSLKLREEYAQFQKATGRGTGQ